jgi:o-succinylbenzoate---CoA ligase
MSEYSSIRINHKVYNLQHVNELFLDIDDEGEKQWVLAIHDFLTEWFSEIPFIEARTSGSTGIPKNIQLPKNSMINSARATCSFFGLTESDTALLCLPASYIAGKMMLVRAIACGFNLLVVKPSSNPFLNITARIDFTAITPHQLFESIDTIRNVDIQKIIVGGSAVSPMLEDKLQTMDCAVYETYGMTETCSHIALRRLNGAQRSDKFTVLDGISIQTDEFGCLVIDAPLLTPDAIVTNDMVKITDSSHFRWLGRFDHVVNSGGIKLFPEQIETKLEPFLSGKIYFVAGVKDEKLGEKLILLIEGTPFAMEDISKLKQTLRETLPPLEIPREILFIKQFPRSETGKILKLQVLEIGCTNK